MKFLSVIGVLIGAFIALFILGELYEWIRRKCNRTKFGLDNLSLKMLKDGDYVMTGNSVLRFHYIGLPRLNPTDCPMVYEPAQHDFIGFYAKGLGNVYHKIGSEKGYKYIWGKYGLKWALNEEWAKIAKAQHNRYMDDYLDYYIGNVVALKVDGIEREYNVVDFIWDSKAEDWRYIFQPVKAKGLTLALTPSDIYLLKHQEIYEDAN